MPKASIKDKIIQWSHIDYLCKPIYAGMGTILMFHQVLPPSSHPFKPNRDLQVSPTLLENVIKYLKSLNYSFLSLDEIAERLGQQSSNPQRFAAFTFDDGYHDNLQYAYPVFKKYQVPFTIYVTTSFPDRTAILWWYLLEDFVREQSSITFEGNNKTYHFNCQSLHEKAETFNHIRHYILYGENDTLEERVQHVFADKNIDLQQNTATLALSWDDLQQLDADPLVNIGAHTVDHYALSQLPRAQARAQIQQSKQIIEAKLGHDVRHFAYPFGTAKTAGEREFEIAKSCGFVTATTTRSGNLFKQHSTRMQALPRISIREKKFSANVRYLRQYLNGLQQCVKKPLKVIM